MITAFIGGPAYYMEQGLNKQWLAVTFAVLITICFGFVFQCSSSKYYCTAFNNAFGMDKLFIGISI